MLPMGYLSKKPIKQIWYDNVVKDDNWYVKDMNGLVDIHSLQTIYRRAAIVTGQK